MFIDRDKVPPKVLALALRNESAFLVAVRTTSHAEAARRLGVSKQTYHDWREDNSRDFLLALAAYGLKLVPHDAETYVAADIEAMQQLAQKGLVALRPLKTLLAPVDADETVPGDL